MGERQYEIAVSVAACVVGDGHVGRDDIGDYSRSSVVEFRGGNGTSTWDWSLTMIKKYYLLRLVHIKWLVELISIAPTSYSRPKGLPRLLMRAYMAVMYFEFCRLGSINFIAVMVTHDEATDRFSVEL